MLLTFTISHRDCRQHFLALPPELQAPPTAPSSNCSQSSFCEPAWPCRSSVLKTKRHPVALGDTSSLCNPTFESCHDRAAACLPGSRGISRTQPTYPHAAGEAMFRVFKHPSPHPAFHLEGFPMLPAYLRFWSPPLRHPCPLPPLDHPLPGSQGCQC